MRRLFAVAFWVSVAATLFLTLRPVTDPQPLPFPHFDKLAHAGMWFLMGVLGGGVYGRSRRQAVGLLVALCALGVWVEIAQVWIPGRSGEVLDGLADWTGAAMAFGLWFRWITGRRDSNAGPPFDPVV